MSLSEQDKRIAYLLTHGPSEPIQEDQGEHYADLFGQKEVQTKDLLLFYDWLCLGEVDEEVSSFLQRDGLNILSIHLLKVEREAQRTLDFNREVMILKILLELTAYSEVREDVANLQHIVNSVALCLSLLQVEVTTIVIDILTNICWIDGRGSQVVLTSLEFLKATQNFHYMFEPLIRILEESKSIVMVCTVCTFLNTLIEAPTSKEQRNQLKEELMIRGISVVYGDIKMKIADEVYRVQDCS